ncbi:MAG TPA: hypothetical protein P5298_08675 [Spirochaetia bacterium]|nr:hypothetical protein [Spirochaetales bacterium]HRW24472.1 hypothetical protein [Spirochaetia bacterium]
MITLPFAYRLDHGGVVIEAVVTHLSPSDVTVELVSPFPGVRYGLHAPYFAMYERNRNLGPDGGVSAKGWGTIRACAIGAYERGLGPA